MIVGLVIYAPAAGAQVRQQTNAATAATATFGTSVLITPAKIAQLKAVVANKTEPNYTGWVALVGQANRAIGRADKAPSTWFVPNRYDDPDGEYAARSALQNDANDTLALAIAFAVTGDAKYSTQAVKFITAWSKIGSFTKTTQTQLSWSYHFPSMIFGAALLRTSAAFTSAQQTAFSGLIRRSLLTMSTAYTHTNNLGSWGLVFEIGSAAYLKDATRFNNAISRHRAIQEVAIDANGVLNDEVHRQDGNQGNGSSGLWYVNFALMPMTYTAEVAMVNGVDLYNYTSPSGGRLITAFKKAAVWSADPSTFYFNTSGTVSTFNPLLAGYFEMLNARWPNAQAKTILAANQPVQARQSIIGQTFLYGGSIGATA